MTDTVVILDANSSTVEVEVAAEATSVNVITEGPRGVKGDKGDKGDRGFVGPQGMTPNVERVSGVYYDNTVGGSGATTLSLSANVVVLAPFFVTVGFSIDQLGVFVSSLGNQIKLCIYEAGINGWPDELIFESPSAISINSTGFKSENVEIALETGKQYWLGVRSSSTGGIYGIPSSSIANLGLTASTSSFYYTVLRRTITFANALPANWEFVSSDLQNANPPSIRMRVA